MNWLSKIDSMLPTVKTAAVEFWVVGAVLGLCMAVVSAVIAARSPILRSYMRDKIRIFRYCHDCKFADLNTEACSVNADRKERCGIIDRQAGMDFTVTKNS